MKSYTRTHIDDKQKKTTNLDQTFEKREKRDSIRNGFCNGQLSFNLNTFAREIEYGHLGIAMVLSSVF